MIVRYHLETKPAAADYTYPRFFKDFDIGDKEQPYTRQVVLHNFFGEGERLVCNICTEQEYSPEYKTSDVWVDWNLCREGQFACTPKEAEKRLRQYAKADGWTLEPSQ